MESKALTFNPKHTLGIVRRYLHVLALLQNKTDPAEWNSNTLADMISLETDEPLSDKVIRGDISKYIEGDLGFAVATKKGAKNSRLSTEIDEETLLTLLMTYADFVITDSARERALRSFISEKKETCLWLLARIHFATVEKKKIRIDYINTSKERISVVINPYHLVLRENKIYLVGWFEPENCHRQFILSQIHHLEVLDARFSETIPPVKAIYEYSNSAFIWKGDPVRMIIQYKAEQSLRIKAEFSHLNPVYNERGEWNEMTFLVWDYESVCRQLFYYGSDVVIVSPEEVRAWMVEHLRSSLSGYNREK